MIPAFLWTRRCHGCSDPSLHDSHLTVLGRLEFWLIGVRDRSRRVMVTVVGPAEICGRLGHVEVFLGGHPRGMSVVGKGCLRCGAILEQKVYRGQFPAPREG